MTVWPLESKEYGVSAMDDAPSTLHRDVILMVDMSPEGQAIAAALRAQGFAVATSTVERLEASVLEESPRVLIVDIDQPGAREAIERIRDLTGGSGAELVCLGNPSRAAEVGATKASGRAFARPVDIHTMLAQIGALADPAPIDEAFIDEGMHETTPRRPGESVPPVFVGDGSGAFSAVFQSVFPTGPDPSEMGSSIFPPDENDGHSPAALLVMHPMQLSPELMELLANAEQKMLREASVSLPPAAQAEEDSDIVLGEEYLSLLDDLVDPDEDAPGTGPEMAQTGALETTTGPLVLPSLATSRSGALSMPDTSPPVTSAPPQTIDEAATTSDPRTPFPRIVLGQIVARDSIKMREVVPEKLPISYTDEVSSSMMPTRPVPVAPNVNLDPPRVNRHEDTKEPPRRIDAPSAVASVKPPVAPIVIEAPNDVQPPTVFPGRLSGSITRVETAPLTASSSPTTRPSMMPSPSTINPPTINPSTLNPPTVNPSIAKPPTPAFVPTSVPKLQAPNIGAPTTSKPVSPPLAPAATSTPQSPSPSTAPASTPAPSSPRPTKPTPLLPPPNIVRRVASEPPPSVRLAPPVPPPPAPVPVAAGSGGQTAAPTPGEKPTVLGPADVPRALARAIASRVTGSLALHSQGAVRRVVLHEGDVVTAGSGVAEETLLSFLAARGDIARDVATRLAGKLPPGGRHAGAALIAHGYLGQDALWPVLRAHAEWLIGGFLSVESGTLELEPEPPGRLRAEPSVFGGSTGAEVFVEMVRRIVPPETAQSRLGGLAARLDDGPRIGLLAECALRPDEQALAQAAAGATISELVDRAGGDVSTLLYALVCLEVLTALAPSRHVEKSRPAMQDPLDAEAIRMRVKARLALVEEGDYFAVLGVPHGATSYEIRRAFLDLRRSFEPSRLLTAETADLTGAVRTVLEVLDEAYEILKDEHRRERYRRAIEAGPAG